jgi:hypothetical protein
VPEWGTQIFSPTHGNTSGIGCPLHEIGDISGGILRQVARNDARGN